MIDAIGDVSIARIFSPNPSVGLKSFREATERLKGASEDIQNLYGFFRCAGRGFQCIAECRHRVFMPASRLVAETDFGIRLHGQDWCGAGLLKLLDGWFKHAGFLQCQSSFISLFRLDVAVDRAVGRFRDQACLLEGCDLLLLFTLFLWRLEKYRLVLR